MHHICIEVKDIHKVSIGAGELELEYEFRRWKKLKRREFVLWARNRKSERMEKTSFFCIRKTAAAFWSNSSKNRDYSSSFLDCDLRDLPWNTAKVRMIRILDG